MILKLLSGLPFESPIFIYNLTLSNEVSLIAVKDFCKEISLTSLVLFLVGCSPLTYLLLGLVDSIIHYHIDFIKSNIWKEKKLKPTDQTFWVIHGVDQLLHGLTYIFIIWIIL